MRILKNLVLPLALLWIVSQPLAAQNLPLISEFMAANTHTLADENGDFSDWIEIYNPGPLPVNLNGWFLADSSTRWRFPATNLAANAYLVVFASNKDRRIPGRPLHTNFRLQNNGEYLALIQPDGLTVASAFSPAFPIQANDISYGFPVTPSTVQLIATGATARLLVPTGELSDSNWMRLDFDDSAWTPVENGVGFEIDPDPVPAITILADSVADFTGNQGSNFWFYGYWDKKADSDGVYSPDDFIAFPRGTGTTLNSTNYWNGTKWDWPNPSNPPWTELSNAAGHPQGDNGDPLLAVHWTIRRYLAETNGLLRITGTLECNSGGGTCGDGTIGHIFVDGLEVFQQTVFGSSFRYSIVVQVNVGSRIDFAIDPGANNNDWCDATTFTATIRPAETAAPIANTTADWPDSGLQGYRNWTYGYFIKTNSSLAYATSRFLPFPNGSGPHSTANYWDGALWRWFDGDPPFDTIAQDFVRPSIYPSGNQDGLEHWVIRRWVSDFAGTITIDWHFSKKDNTGGGAIARVYYNNTQKDTATLTGADTTGFNKTIAPFRVQPGDIIDFTVEPGTDIVGDICFFNAAIHGVTTLSNQFQTDISVQMANVNPSALLRIPFAISNALDFASLNLRVKSDDGFVGYLNGSPVASRNAPETPAWNSTATESRLDAEAVEFEDFSLTRVRDLLRVGDNVLAIQGLNRSASDPDFLIVAELSAGLVTFDTNTPNYFLVPTPGAPNGIGSSKLGPIITDITHTPHEPAALEPLTVTARISPTFNPVDTVRLYYRIMFASETNLLMFDDGAHGDGAAGDGVFGATIPTGGYTNGHMIRYYISAADSRTNLTRQPPFPDPVFSSQYLGAVVQNPALTNPLPVLHMFITDANLSSANSSSAGRWPVALYYLGEFYDNVGINRHGQSSSGSEFLRKSYDLDFNPDHHFKYDPNEERVDDLNMLTTYSDKSKMRNMLAYDTYKDADGPYHFAFPVRLQHNGNYYADYNIVENGDADWLKRIHRDPHGALYKMYNQFNDPGTDVLISANTEAEKKTRKDEGNADLVALMAGVSQSGAARDTYAFDNLNIPVIVNMLAARVITGDIDCCHKNYYFYRDTEDTGEWEAMPWDVDLSFGRNWTECSNYWGDGMHPDNGIGTGGGNRFFDCVLGSAANRQMYLRRMRTLMDELLQPPGTPTNQLKFEAQMDRWLALIAPDAELEKTRWATWGNCQSPSTCCTQSVARAVEIMKTLFMDPRRTNIYSAANAWRDIPTAQPTNASILITGLDFNPTNGNQAQEYIELRNTNNYSVDISGWTLSGAVDFKFIGGTVILTNGLAYVVPDKKAFRARTSGPRGGQRLFVLGPYKGQLSARGETIILTDKSGRIVNTNAYPGNPTPAQTSLRITEIMYHPPLPPTGSPFFEEDFEYLELKNIGPAPLDLTGVHFVTGVEFTFTGSAVTNLNPGEYVLVVKNIPAFTSRYGSGFRIAGQYTGSLDNAGENIRLDDAVGEKILDFAYDNRWYPITDGPGASLVIVDENAPWNTWGLATSWRPSAHDPGSPGQPDPTPQSVVPVLVNEALTHTDLPVLDAIELFNPGTNDANLAGWFISDDFANPKKFRIPNGTVLRAGNYLVFTENDFNPTPGVPPSFSFSSKGDEAYLFSGDGTNLTGYFHGFRFGAAENSVTFGRYTNSVGLELFVAQSANTLGTNNAYPKVGPVVISEIMYHPPDLAGSDNTGDEYLELHNILDQPVNLFDPLHPTNTWQIAGGVDFAFPTNTSLPAGGYALVVSFDPANPDALARFRARYGLGQTVPIYGPYHGRLDNASEAVELYKPDPPELGTVPYVLVERVEYSDRDPWPVEADGVGPSLQRVHVDQFGNDPANWAAALSPGAPYGGTPPLITTQPAGVAVVARRTATFTVDAVGTSPLIFQWRRNGTNIPGANSLTLVLTNVQTAQAGNYSVIVFNPAGSVESSNALLTVQIPPSITTQPLSQSVRAGSNFTLRVVAVSSTPTLTYQWQQNGIDIPDATNSTYAVTNAQFEHNGNYRVVVTDPIATEISDLARITILIEPQIILQPISGFVKAGETLTLTAIVTNTATVPMAYRWRRNGINILTNVSSYRQNTFTWTNIQIANAGTFSVVTTNEAKPGGLLGSNTFIAVVRPPTNQVVPAGADATFNITVGNPSSSASRPLPIFYQWQFNAASLLNETNPALTISNVQSPLLGAYAVAVTVVTNTNTFLGFQGTFPASLSLPAQDTDADGLPDDWENLYPCLQVNTSDASADPDGDGMSNLQEYLAGTDPCNRDSYLKVELVRVEGAGVTNVVLRFGAVSNKTYTIQYQNLLNPTSAWSRLQHIDSAPTNRNVEVLDPSPAAPARYYRLATPQQP